MIQFRGYGLFIVFVDYFGGLFALNQFGPTYLNTEKQQYLALLLFHIIISAVNFFFARFLNRKGVKHTFFELSLEKFVLVVGLIFLPIVILMGRGVIY